MSRYATVASLRNGRDRSRGRGALVACPSSRGTLRLSLVSPWGCILRCTMTTARHWGARTCKLFLNCSPGRGGMHARASHQARSISLQVELAMVCSGLVQPRAPSPDPVQGPARVRASSAHKPPHPTPQRSDAVASTPQLRTPPQDAQETGAFLPLIASAP